ncbi:hypothetical protein EVAR_55258_1 [Eumeta japonica]|uniref:Uncharacterized protein n=1 Tax=Eumeta variegata TaxID=151549 RepID=A0A4C1Z6Z5_EUMVA|nr:hypothetical protein EVAR_55258_1 [Eumeta japonica]
MFTRAYRAPPTTDSSMYMLFLKRCCLIKEQPIITPFGNLLQNTTDRPRLRPRGRRTYSHFHLRFSCFSAVTSFPHVTYNVTSSSALNDFAVNDVLVPASDSAPGTV